MNEMQQMQAAFAAVIAHAFEQGFQAGRMQREREMLEEIELEKQRAPEIEGNSLDPCAMR